MSVHVPGEFLDLRSLGVDTNKQPDVEVDREGKERCDVSSITRGSVRQRTKNEPKSRLVRP